MLAGGTGTSVTLQTNGVNNTSQTALNFLTSTTNSDGLTVTPSNPATSQEKMEVTGNYSGVLASGVTGTTQTPYDNSTKMATTAYVDQLRDPSVSYWNVDDFDFVTVNGISGTPVNSHNTYFPRGSAGGTITCNTNPVPANMFAGYCELDTSTALNGVLSLANITAQGLFPLNATTFDFKIRSQLSTTASVGMYMGMAAVGGSVFDAAADYIAIRYDTGLGDTNFMCVGSSGGVTTTAIIAAPDTAVHTFRIRSTTPGTILCSMDGGTEVSVSAHIPTVNIGYASEIWTHTTANASLTLDYWRIYVALSR